jgi:Xaa-Pro aminopeptidase
MLTAEGCAARRARLWASPPRPCDVILITTPESLAYFSGYSPSPFVFNTVESAAALILFPDRAVLIADNLVEPFLRASWADEVVSLAWYAGKKSAPPRRQLLAQAVSERLNPEAVGVLGIDAAGHDLTQGGNQVDLSPLIRTLRRSKDPDELAVLRSSVKAGEAGHAAALAAARPGMTELDVFLLVQEAAARALGEPAWIYGDFVSGTRCEVERGGRPSRRVIEPGDLFLLDFSVVVSCYRADFTNTFVVGAEPSSRQCDLQALCMEAMSAGEALLRLGMEARLVDAAVRGHFARHGLDEFFPSHTGHGLGLGHPEPPYLVPESTDSLVAGDVIALEPGLYIPGEAGMRIEHNYVITATGYERLTHHSLRLTQA